MEIELKFDNDAYKKTSHVPQCVISDFNLGTMRFKWDEDNQVRKNYFSKLYPDKKIIDIELCHSKKIMEVENQFDIEQIQKNQILADGIITKNTDYVPVVTVADCMSIFIFDDKSLTFGVLHSGWKGTGISEEAINIILKKNPESKPENLHIILGPHIKNCCYQVDQERKEYFSKNFTPECITQLNGKIYLSLEKANLFVLEKNGITRKNIVSYSECTCCTKLSDEKNSLSNQFKYGSFRRQKVLE
ncbi:MAG: polyphenol oxidase family protein, partial [Spirochaetaceae bacterium]|nr:polyphenol oxidase family protein [Spirochaetaceae bacterium]